MVVADSSVLATLRLGSRHGSGCSLFALHLRVHARWPSRGRRPCFRTDRRRRRPHGRHSALRAEALLQTAIEAAVDQVRDHRRCRRAEVLVCLSGGNEGSGDLAGVRVGRCGAGVRWTEPGGRAKRLASPAATKRPEPSWRFAPRCSSTART